MRFSVAAVLLTSWPSLGPAPWGSVPLIVARPPAAPCEVLTTQVAETVLRGSVELVDMGRCDWKLLRDPRSYIEFATNETGGFGPTPRVRPQVLKDVGDSAVWYPLSGSYELDAYTKGTHIQIWIYHDEDGASTLAGDLTAYRIVARDIIKHLQ